jgi:hypothetical protein
MESRLLKYLQKDKGVGEVVSRTGLTGGGNNYEKKNTTGEKDNFM